MVRPDGKITLPLLNDVQAAGLTPEQLREPSRKAAAKFVQDPNVTVIVKTDQQPQGVRHGPGGQAGPVSADGADDRAAAARAGRRPDRLRQEGEDRGDADRERADAFALTFNYKDVLDGKNLDQNILLKPGDTVIVP